MEQWKLRARIVWADDGGPIRRIINGRHDRPTGFLVLRKGGFRAMPWDSRSCEKPALQLANLSSRVVSLMAQPHRLEMELPGERVMKYIPDLMLKVHPSFLRDLKRGQVFSQVASSPATEVVPTERASILILELKNDKDPRDKDDAYKRKLKFARLVYKQMGITFLTLRRSPHLSKKLHLLTARMMLADQSTALSPADYANCVSAFAGREWISYQKASNALGSGPIGKAKLHALHCRQFVSIDLGKGLKSFVRVWLMEGAR